jgi:hypothetical protein
LEWGGKPKNFDFAKGFLEAGTKRVTPSAKTTCVASDLSSRRQLAAWLEKQWAAFARTIPEIFVTD